MRKLDIELAELNILNVTVLLDEVTGGGTAERTFQLSRHLMLKGHKVTVLTTSVGLSRARVDSLAGIGVVALPCIFKRFFVVLPRLGLVYRLVRDADVIHLMGHWNLLNVLVYYAARMLKKPYAVCPAGELRLFGRSHILKRLFNFLVGHRLIRYASAWIAVTDDEKPQYENYGISPSAVSVLPNGIDPDDLLLAGRSDILDRLGLCQKKYVLFVGRLNSIKGPDLLLEAFLKIAFDYPDLQLVFAGPDGGLKKSLEQSVEVHALRARVHLVGFVSGAEKAALYRGALLLAIPSRHEAMSIVVLEAGVVAVPVMLTDRCGFDEVENSGGGVVVKPDVESISKGIGGLLSRSAELSDMGCRLNALVMENFTWEIAIGRYCDVFADMVAPSIRSFPPAS